MRLRGVRVNGAVLALRRPASTAVQKPYQFIAVRSALQNPLLSLDLSLWINTVPHSAGGASAEQRS